MSVITFSSKIACEFIEFVRKQGHDVSQMQAILALPESYLNREDIRIPSGKMSQLWMLAMELTGDEDIGFHMGIKMSAAAALRTTSLIMQSSATLYEALKQGIEYSELIANALSMKMGENTDHIYIEFTPKKEWNLEPALIVKDCLNLTFISMLISVHQMTGKSYAPSTLCFTYPKPDNVSEYYRAFNCSIEFEQTCNQIGFPKNLGNLPILTSDQGLLAVLEQYANEIKQSFSNEQHYVSRTREQIIKLMDPQPPTLEEVARSLNLSSRSLQRKIKLENGCSYREILDEIRKKLCDKYLEDSHRTIDEIAFLTGYADTTSFIRAFKRWYGNTPRQGK